MKLTTKDLNKILQSNCVTKRYFFGTYPACYYPLSRNYVYSFITNTDDHGSPGQHWNSWFIRDGKISFFDSFGRPPDHPAFPPQYQDLVKRFDELEYSRTQIQGLNATTCGMFCAHFIYFLSLGLNFQNFIDDYSSDFDINEKIVYDFIDSIM